MKLNFATSVLLAISAFSACAPPPTNGFCVENHDDRAALFAVDAGGHYRALQTLAPGESLCTPEFERATSGFVSVFYDEDAIEGCSRLAAAGAVQVLLTHHDFDNCAWQISP